jgi:surface antigen
LRPPVVQSASLPKASHALYRAWGRIGLSAIRPIGAVTTLILIGLGSSGCSMPRGDGPFARMSDSDLATGSISPQQGHGQGPTDSDLAFARDAASDVLTKGDKDSSQPWENAKTGAHGSVTPLAKAYTADDGRNCRDFLASYVNGDTESWLQGAACQTANGRWDIRTLKPWRRG